MRRFVLAIAMSLAAAPVAAEDFRILLGDRVLGVLDYTPGQMSTRLDNTPLGAADGTFRAVRTGNAYVAVSDERRIEVDFRGARPVATRIAPESERTPLSDPDAVPGGVVDPITGLGRIIEAHACSESYRMYDGRRAVEVTPAGRDITGDVLTCEMDYRVIAGPGHVSPFRLSRLRLTARYVLRDGRVAGFADLVVRAGPFALRLAR